MATVAASRAPATAPGDVPASHPYTCQTCQIALRSSELQRAHMRSDWHRYNLKRRVTSLPPISADVFQSKVIDAQASATTAASRASFEKTCAACEKTYFSENAFYNHVGSKKHLKQVAQLRRRAPADDAASIVTSQVTATVDESDDESEKEDVKNATDKMDTTTAEDEAEDEEEKEVEVPLKRCLFCNYESPTLDLNVTHMERIHNMFIPERQYLVDLEGLITSLWEKINILQECLTCGKLKPTVFGLQTHMRDKSHCSIPFHTENEQLEIGEFYDFRGTYSDQESESEDEEETKDNARASAASKLGAARKAKIAKKVAQDDEDEEMEDADGWETDSSVSSLDSADLTAVPLSGREHRYEKLDRHPHHAAGSDPRPHKTADGYHSHAHKKTHAAYFDEYELHLPSGRAVGHRSLAKYFKQNLHNHPSPAERQEQFMIEQARHDSDGEEERDSRVVARENRERGRALNTRAEGGRGMMGVADHKKKEVAVKHKKAQKQEHYDRQKFNWGVNKQNNSQKHWRDHLLQ